MHLFTAIVQDWKANIKTLVGILSLFFSVFILTMPAEARDYHIQASDGEVYTLMIGEDSNIKDFSVQKLDGEVLRGVTEAERATVAELYFAAMFFSDVLPFYSPETPIEDWGNEIKKIAKSGLIRLIGKQGIDKIGNAFINGLTGAVELLLTGSLEAIIGGWIPGAVNDAIQNEAEHRLLIDAANLALGAAGKASEHEQVLRNFWLSCETRSLTISIDKVNAGWMSFYKLAAYRSLAANLIDRYLKDPESDVKLGLGGLDNIALSLMPSKHARETVVQATVKSLQVFGTAIEILKTAISVSYTQAHIQQLREINENANSAIHQGASSSIVEGKIQARARLEQVNFFQPMQVAQKPEENIGDLAPKNDIANEVGVIVESPIQNEPPDDREFPDRPDLVVTNITVDPDTVHPGERFRVSAAVENIGRGRNVSVRFYRSSDSIYSTDDEEITGWHRSLGVLRSRDEPESVHANLDAPMEPGDYYYIVRVDTARDEIKTTNNSDFIKITVLPPPAPDLVVSLSVARTKHVEWHSETEGVVDPDKYFKLDATIDNRGGKASEETVIHFYRSLDPIPSPDDEEIDPDRAQTVKVLRRADNRFYNSDEESENGPAPSEPGVYYYYAYVDSVLDERKTDNNYSNVVTITVRGPDLIVDSIWEDLATRKDTLAPNGIFEIYATVRNQGTEDASRTTLRYYQSSDAIISTDDTQIDEDHVYSLDINETSKENKSRWIYAPYAAGIYYYGACIDILEDETHKNNNCSEAISVTVRNIAPQKDGSIDDQMLHIGTSRSIDVSDYFSDANKDSLTYNPRSNDIDVVTLSQTNAKVTINPRSVGNAIVTVVASDGELTAKQTFSVSVSNDVDPVLNPDESNAPDLSSEVFILDANLRAAVRSQLGLVEGDTLTQQEMQKLTTLKTSDSRIEDLTGLEHATHLTELSLTGTNQFGNITPLANLTALTDLHFSISKVSDLSPLAGLTALTRLDIRYSPISDLSPLAGLTALTMLYFESTNISDLSPLASLTALTSLTLDKDRVSDISPLKGLTTLTSLNFYSNQITDISALKDLKALRSLTLRSNQVSDISPLRGLTTLRSLNIRENQVTDISALRDLKALTNLNIRENQITDVTPLVNLMDLMYLSIEGNPITDLVPLRRLKEKNPSMNIDININADLDNVQGAPTASVLPVETVLLSNYPNPFNPETWIPYQLANTGDVQINIYDVQGVLVRVLSLRHQSAGYYTSQSRAAYWDGRNALGEPVASGVYFYTFTTGDFTATRKMLIRK